MRIFRGLIVSGLVAVAGCSAPADSNPPPPNGTTAQLALLESTDIHTNVLSYDYFRL
jgi:2',3'-cyclic-nucleotide 2'-phosphodiesterase/3'-nucleotidase